MLSNCDLTDIGSYSFHSLINFDMHDRFWQVSDTMGMSISQKPWIKKQNFI